MALSDTQVRQLKAKLEAKHVKTRKANGADLNYVEGWHVIAEANRIFGYDAWDRKDARKPLRVEGREWPLPHCSLHRQGTR
jgi:recombination DNA repair RAD52 pathway protein